MTEFSKNNKRTMVCLIPKFPTDNTEVKPAKRKEPSRSFGRGLQPRYGEEAVIQTFRIIPTWYFFDDFRSYSCANFGYMFSGYMEGKRAGSVV